MSLRIAVAQCNPVAGDLAANAHAIALAARRAHAQGAHLLLLPDGALTGQPLYDLAQRPAFVQACARQMQALAAELADLAGLVVILPHAHVGQASQPVNKPLNKPVKKQVNKGNHPCGCGAWTVLQHGRCVTHPAHAGAAVGVVEVQAAQGLWQRVAVLLRLDEAGAAIDADALAQIRQADARVLLVAGAAPYRMGQVPAREQSLTALAQAAGLPVVSAHLVGGHGEHVYDGASLAVQADGTVAGRAAQFDEALWLVSAQAGPSGWALQASTAVLAPADGCIAREPFAQAFSHAEVWQALVLGLRDYVRKSGFCDVVLGLSGGIDSALVLALAVDALGSRHVRTLMMPSAHTADISLADAAEMAQRLGVRHDVLPIAPLCAAVEGALAPLFAGRAADVTEENIQARMRGQLLMAMSNKYGAMLLSTGNKSELSVGYCTLYGDMAGGLAPLKDIFKTQVYALARWRNAHDGFGMGSRPIPERIITRAPSAELRPDQTDQDSLPPYEVLDAILAGYMECDATPQQLCAAGLPADAVRQTLRLLRGSEYKRWQAAPGLCLSRRAYGADWRYPLSHRFAEGEGELKA